MRFLIKGGGLSRGWIMLAASAWLTTGALRAEDDAVKAYDSFLTLSKNNTAGVVLTKIEFGADGRVKLCRIVRSNAPYALEASTIYFIESRWKNPFFAGETRYIPITFDQLPSYVSHWNDDMVPPPDPLVYTDTEHALKLRLTFGPDGWIKKVEVISASGLDTLDQQAELWVQVHWHHDAYANQVIDAPFRFEPPAPPPAPKAVVAKKTKPVAPAEPVAIPAERVQ